jgi:hypothetical protein
LAPPNQVHDFNPGVTPFPTGLFWTAAVPAHSISFDFEDAEASLELNEFEIDDYHDVVNALTTDKDVATGHVDVNLEWSGVLKRGSTRVADPTRRFENHFIQDRATLEWSASEPGFEFESTSSSMGFAEIARERNGTFFK